MSALQRYRFETEITFIAPVISQAAGDIGFGMDAAMLRDHDGHFAIPGSLIQGNLKQYWKALFETDLGLGNAAEGDYRPQRGVIAFSEYWSSD